MITSTMCCQGMLLSITTMLILPAIHLASAGIARQRVSSALDRRVAHHHHHPHSTLSSDPISSSTSSVTHHSDDNGDDNTVSSRNHTSSTLPSFLDESYIELPKGIKFIGLDEDNTPFIIIPNVKHHLDNKSDLMGLLKSALRDAHRTKRSPSVPSRSASSSSSSSSSECVFRYKVTVTRRGRCIRFGDYPACLSGDQLFPFAPDC